MLYHLCNLSVFWTLHLVWYFQYPKGHDIHALSIQSYRACVIISTSYLSHSCTLGMWSLIIFIYDCAALRIIHGWKDQSCKDLRVTIQTAYKQKDHMQKVVNPLVALYKIYIRLVVVYYKMVGYVKACCKSLSKISNNKPGLCCVSL